MWPAHFRFLKWYALYKSAFTYLLNLHKTCCILGCHWLSFYALMWCVVERRPTQACCQHGSIPAPAFLHAGLCSTDVTWQPAVPCTECTRADTADVWRQEHDGCVWSTPRSLPHRRCHLPWTHVNEGGRVMVQQLTFYLHCNVFPVVNLYTVFFSWL